MDKEAIEKIAQILQTWHGNCDWEEIPIEGKGDYLADAQQLLYALEELGYRKPLDRPELREDVWNILASVMNYGRQWGMKPLDGTEQVALGEDIDQILALIPDEKEIRKAVVKEIIKDADIPTRYNYNATCYDCLEGLKSKYLGTPSEKEIKHYEEVDNGGIK